MPENEPIERNSEGMMDNMTIWNKVCQTDPEFTKKVEQRGGFTAIDPIYQIKRATEVFGPIGLGWGVTGGYEFQLLANVCFVTFTGTIWYKIEGLEGKEGPYCACNLLIDSKGKLDEDAPKKARTDVTTKILSHLGFSADVFEGKFDDNKYVDELKKEIAAKAKAKEKAKTEDTDPEKVANWLDKFTQALRVIPDEDTLNRMLGKYDKVLSGMQVHTMEKYEIAQNVINQTRERLKGATHA